jgi:hypothetical protein
MTHNQFSSSKFISKNAQNEWDDKKADNIVGSSKKTAARVLHFPLQIGSACDYCGGEIHRL